MPSENDASVKLVYAVDAGTDFTIDDIKLDAAFDVQMDVEIGSELNRHVSTSKARIGVRNLTQSKTVATLDQAVPLIPGGNPFLAKLTFNVLAGTWGVNAAVGDVLQIVASYQVTAGIDNDVSMAESPPFIVSA